MNFKSELKILQKELNNSLQALESKHTPLPGHDDTLSYQRRPVLNEYNKKLKELKAKYDVK